MNKRSWFGIVLAVVVAIAMVSFSQVRAGQAKQAPRTKNVILMVGDGMGKAQRDAIRLSSVGLHGETAMDNMPYTGYVHTNSADPEEFVTDSAAAATAMATGVKTYNGAIGVDRHKKPVETVLEKAKKLGKATGLVTTSQVTDATPAAFGAHVEDRDDQSRIARQYLENSRPDVILGGGEDYWYPAGNSGRHPDRPADDPSEGSKGTEGNLVELAKKLGYQYVSDHRELQKANGARLLGLFANEEMFQYGTEAGDKYNPLVSLPEMTDRALETLSRNKNGFFLLVEEEGIDSMCHVNNAELAIEAGRQFDRAVARAKKFARKHGDTLVIVVGDHETGGFTIEPLDDSDESGDGTSAEDGPFPVAKSNQQFIVDWTTEGHTAVDVPLTAMGPGAERLQGVYENTHIHDVVVKLMRAGN
ncbi:alkaline phosphatase [Thermoactinomyces mirandus]|uniref:Alkaline phosphatase n=1 Tax=Thermoactinomyces mirandus TaxID=2756294 RepID=A0A7W1XTU0_9BACL|nr:alkaline phosphatase [Thermoactinomyces mirandus]